MAQAADDLGREPYWRMVIGRWRRSGRSVRAFCRAEGINEPKFYWWRRRLELAEQPKPSFLPVHVVANDADQPTARNIEVVLANGRSLRVPPGFDPHTLKALVEILEAGGTSC
jgi:transposase